MAKLKGSVGQNGDNLRDDVRLVQKLLNDHNLAPLRPLSVDGRVGPLTIESIRHFQSKYVGMQSPDGRIDPGGKSFRRLSGGGGTQASPPYSSGNAETRKSDREAMNKFVDPRVKKTAVTERILQKLMPAFSGVRAKVISGYLSDADLFWKVNYHWEYLLNMVEHSLTLPVDKQTTQTLQSIRSSLMSCRPDPSSGYTTSPLGKPVDKSSMDDMKTRHRVLRQQKREFKSITEKAGLKRKSRKTPKAFDLAAAPVAFPGTSKHGTGYALDIQGDNSAIKSKCKGLGATLVFDEKSHIHVEFKNGISS